MKLKKQEEEIRRRQEEIAKELMASDMSVSSVDEVMVCQAREGQVFVGKKPHYLETVLDSNVVDVQQLNTSDWSSSDAESMQKERIHIFKPKRSEVMVELDLLSLRTWFLCK